MDKWKNAGKVMEESVKNLSLRGRVADQIKQIDLLNETE